MNIEKTEKQKIEAPEGKCGQTQEKHANGTQKGPGSPQPLRNI